MGRANASINKKTEARSNRARVIYVTCMSCSEPAGRAYRAYIDTHAMHEATSSFNFGLVLSRMAICKSLPRSSSSFQSPGAVGQLAENYVIDLKDPY
jgi:hypothetical protein